jgi:hypothetical protein
MRSTHLSSIIHHQSKRNSPTISSPEPTQSAEDLQDVFKLPQVSSSPVQSIRSLSCDSSASSTSAHVIPGCTGSQKGRTHFLGFLTFLRAAFGDQNVGLRLLQTLSWSVHSVRPRSRCVNCFAMTVQLRPGCKGSHQGRTHLLLALNESSGWPVKLRDAVPLLSRFFS